SDAALGLGHMGVAARAGLSDRSARGPRRRLRRTLEAGGAPKRAATSARSVAAIATAIVEAVIVRAIVSRAVARAVVVSVTVAIVRASVVAVVRAFGGAAGEQRSGDR